MTERLDHLERRVEALEDVLLRLSGALSAELRHFALGLLGEEEVARLEAEVEAEPAAESGEDAP